MSEYAGLPDCPRNEPYKNCKWYGKGSFTMCELCYREAVEGTSLADQLECAVVPTEARCQMYSARMRTLWRLACGCNELKTFLIYAKQTHGPYLIMYMEKQRIEFGRTQRIRRRHSLLVVSMINGQSRLFRF